MVWGILVPVCPPVCDVVCELTNPWEEYGQSVVIKCSLTASVAAVLKCGVYFLPFLVHCWNVGGQFAKNCGCIIFPSGCVSLFQIESNFHWSVWEDIKQQLL